MAKTPTAADVYVAFGYESTEGSAAATRNMVFGRNVRFTPNQTNNYLDNYDLNSQDVQNLVPLQFGGTFDVTFRLADPWWLKAITGTLNTTGAGPYTHTYTMNNTQPSMTIEDGTDIDTDQVMLYLGCKANTATLTVPVNSPAEVTLSGTYINMSKGTTLDGTPAAAAEDPLTFAQTTVELPSATTIDDVQNFSLTLNRNTEVLYGLGSRFGTKTISKARKYQAEMTVPFEAGATLLDRQMGSTTAPVAAPAETATMQVVVTNGLAGVNERSYTIDLADLGVDNWTSAATPVERRDNTSTLFARTFTSIAAVNNTSAEP